MKMTMKNEFTLKHGVILAAAVLLIAGIAFAGAATAIPWNGADGFSNGTITKGTVYITEVSGELQPIENFQTTGELTLIFDNSVEYTLNSAVGSSSGNVGGLFAGNLITCSGCNMTISGLNINEGTVIQTGTSDSKATGGIVGKKTGLGTLIIRDSQIKNVTLTTGSQYTGMIVGNFYQGMLVCDNVSVKDCTFDVSYNGQACVGGMSGIVYTNAAERVTGCTIENCYFNVSGKYVGGAVGKIWSYGMLQVEDFNLVGSVVKGYSEIGGIVGLTDGIVGDKLSLEDVVLENNGFLRNSSGVIINSSNVTNCVISGSGPIGGIIGEGKPCISANRKTGTILLENNEVSYSTLSTGGYSGGFAGALCVDNTSSSVYYNVVNNNVVKNCCVVSTGSGIVAAGFCPYAYN